MMLVLVVVVGVSHVDVGTGRAARLTWSHPVITNELLQVPQLLEAEFDHGTMLAAWLPHQLSFKGWRETPCVASGPGRNTENEPGLQGLRHIQPGHAIKQGLLHHNDIPEGGGVLLGYKLGVH